MKLVRIVKNWDYPDLLRQSPGNSGVWEGIRFTIEPADECDYLVVLNKVVGEKVCAKCPKEHVWAVMQEPYERGVTDWMVEKHEPYSKVFTHHPASFDSKYVTSHPGIPWHVDRSFDALVSSPMPKKTKDLSWIVGDAMELPGHKKRWAFLEYIRRQSSFEIDLYGRAVKFIEDKWDGLAPYRFSLAIENTRGPDYWTEKVADCFLSWTVPFYYGCTNLTDYFPKESFIEIDIDRPLTSLEKIKASVDNGAWLNRVPALEEARRLVLHKYQLFPHLVGLIHTYGYQNASKVALKIPTYMRSSKARIYRTVRKLKKTLRLM